MPDIQEKVVLFVFLCHLVQNLANLLYTMTLGLSQLNKQFICKHNLISITLNLNIINVKRYSEID